MIPIERFLAPFPRIAALVEPHIALLRKAITFALIGVLNTLIDAVIFFIAYGYLSGHEAMLRPLDAMADSCACASHETVQLIAANTMSWIVAVTCSYAMNTFFTFAAESGGKLRLRHYATFLASSVVGAVANTTALVVAAHFMPVLAAKGCAILVAFVVNFSMSHFVVFRARPQPAAEPVVEDAG